MPSLRIGFIGAGRMASALASGLVRQGMTAAAEVLASDPSPAAREAFSRASGGRTTEDNCQVLRQSQVLVLAVKPQQMAGVLSDIRGEVTAGHLLISIAAGVRLASLEQALGPGRRLVRVMPNTPCLVGSGASAYALSSACGAEDAELTSKLLGCVGHAVRLDEKLLDAVTGLSGSGPAFVYLVIEALSDGGVRMGLPREVATALAAQTVRGAAEMVLATGEHPAALKDQVASPGGTTIAGLAALEQGGLRGTLMAAVEAATRRSQELGGA